MSAGAPSRVLMLGAVSAIARETARRLAERGDRLFLVARDGARLETLAADLRVRGADHVATAVADLDDVERHEALIARAEAEWEGLDVAVLAFGTLGRQADCEWEFGAAERVLRTNLLSAVSLLTRLAGRFERRGGGTLVALSSVAGDRGRRGNYVYGAAKGGLSLYLQGLRNRLHGTGVRVVTVKPGMVDTPMTEHLPPSRLFASPERVARGVVAAIDGSRDVVYLPWFWRPLMFVIRAIPEPLFKRLDL